MCVVILIKINGLLFNSITGPFSGLILETVEIKRSNLLTTKTTVIGVGLCELVILQQLLLQKSMVHGR